VIFLKNKIIFQNPLNILDKVLYNIYRKGGERMEGIEKALQEIAKAVKGNEAVTSIKITITVKAKPSKATTEKK